MVVKTNCTPLPVEALLGETVCADTRDTVSSERHIASGVSTRRERLVSMVVSEVDVADGAQIVRRRSRDTKGIVSGRRRIIECVTLDRVSQSIS